MPGSPRIGDAAPLLALAWMTLGGALAHAGWLGLPGSAAWGAGLAVPVLVALVVQHRRAPGPPVSGRLVRALAGHLRRRARCTPRSTSRCSAARRPTRRRCAGR